MAKESFEERLERLKSIVEKLERGDLPLEQGVALYKEGLELSKGCARQLDEARHEVKLVSDGLVREFDALEEYDLEDEA